MKVSLKLSGKLADFYKTSPRVKVETAEIPDGSSVMDVLSSYGIPVEKVHFVVLNKTRVELDAVVKDGDTVWALPLAHGG